MNFSRPPISCDDAVGYAREFYGLRASAILLPSETDRNFKLHADDGRFFVLKISDAASGTELIEAQNQALDHLNRELPHLGIPRVIPDSAGRKCVPISRAASTYGLRLLSYVEGIPVADCRPHSNSLLEAIGGLLGSIDRALLDFDHPVVHRTFVWDLRAAERTFQDCLADMTEKGRRRLAELLFEKSWGRVSPKTDDLRRSVIHGDANDYNFLVRNAGVDSPPGQAELLGLVDFGDLIYSWTIAELAIACAYLLMNKADLLAALRAAVRGYHRELPLSELEMSLLHDLIMLRLLVSVGIGSRNARLHPEDEYLQISQRSAWALLAKLGETEVSLFHHSVRASCGLEPHPEQLAVSSWIQEHSGSVASGTEQDLPGVPFAELDLSVGSSGVPEATAHGGDQEAIESLRRRKELLGPSLSLAYSKPLKITRGIGQFLYDHQGRSYLDCVNNVAHVGHCHPAVVKAAHHQNMLLNTNTRYLHDTILEYAERLTSTLPEPLRVCFFVCSGSEANELALRLARAHTEHQDFLVLEGAYHGNTSGLIDISPYKFEGPGGSGCPKHVHVAPTPDDYRGPFKRHQPRAGLEYARLLSGPIEQARNQGEGVAAFICESILGCGGQIVPPPGYLREAFQRVRSGGGVCIVDEAQTGFGRVGSEFWAFELQDVVPDIVTMGKPIGNGYPLAAVVTTPQIAASFANGMEYFNTFGGNPVSCAVGLAVLDVISREGLQEQSLQVGQHLKSRLAQLLDQFSLIGDVRGEGLFLGIELILDRSTLEPAPLQTSYVVERMKEYGILLSSDGPWHNVIKIKPPLVFDQRDADRLVETLAGVLGETALQG